MRALQAQERERHPNIIIKAGGARQNTESLSQHRRNHFLGCRFSIRARHGNHGQFESAPVFRGELAEGMASILDCNPGAFPRGSRHFTATDDRDFHPFVGDFGEKGVPIELLALQSDK